MAVVADTRPRATVSVVLVEGVAPSAARPIDSGDSRITQSEIGNIPASTPTAMSTYVVRQPVVRMSQVNSGTSRLIPVIDALPSSESAVPRRALNHRATTPEAITGPVTARPSGRSTPYTRAKSQTF